MRQPNETLAINRYDFARRFVQQQALEQGQLTVFDIGAGKLPMKASVETTGSKWFGFDLFPSDPAVTRWNLEEPCPLEVKADVVILLDVVEHLFNPGLALANISNVLKPGEVAFDDAQPEMEPRPLSFPCTGISSRIFRKRSHQQPSCIHILAAYRGSPAV
ncbi:hypothetical protein [Sphingomonas paeninsulae]|uniref:hypothetical protein n=1 Tax=Sphingomonas paeninsulae TaxID=2319844 RepID=UPI0013CED15D|nr:hypothetical protein [Sphingomonas paeninsulae]